MSQLIKIAGYPGEPRASVIFVHGLGGHAYDTWRGDIKKTASDDASFWPLWLAQDVEGITVYVLAYEAPASNWLGTSMPLQDRAVNVLEILLGAPGLKTGPIVFICHSLGGLIVKQLLLGLQQQKDRRNEAKDLLNRVTEIVFAATPHTGSRHASWLDRLRFFAWPSTIARTLAANDPALRAINVAYRGLADERRDVLKHRVFYETQGTPLGVIVDEASSDPGLPGDPPVPIDATHVSIVKPVARLSLVYARTRDFVAAGAPPLEGERGEPEIFDLPPVRSEQPLNLVPKLIRVGAIGLVGLIGYKGLQTLIVPPPVIEPKLVEQIQKPLTEQLQVKDTQIAVKDARIAELTNMLLEKNPTAVTGPGARQAVGAAVQSITQGAEAGDTRLEKALGFLKENKLAEATQLLNEVAKDKTAHAEQASQQAEKASEQAEKATAQAEKDRKQAATAYRNLGAIAGLADPKRALEAYEKALALDPDDIESLYQSGYILVDYGDLNKAQQRFEQVLKLTERQTHEEFGGVGLELTQEDGRIKVVTPTDDSPAARAGILPGDIIAAIDGQSIVGWTLDHAVKRLRGAPNTEVTVKILRGPDEAPNDITMVRATIQLASVPYQRYGAMTGLGDIYVRRGDLNGALKSYDASLAVVDSLSKSDPGNAGLQHDLSVSDDRVGDVLVAQGNLPEALKNFRDGLTIRDRQAKSAPGNAEWQRALSASYDRVGDVLVAQGNLPDALKNFRDGFTIKDRLAKSDPGNAEWQLDLSVSYDRVGDVQKDQGDLSGALKSYSNSLAIREQLAKSDPGNAGWQRDLSVSYAKLADAHKQSGDKAKAGDYLRQGQEIMQRLTKVSPENAVWKKDLAWFDGQIVALDQKNAEAPPHKGKRKAR